MDKDTTNSTFNQLFDHILDSDILGLVIDKFQTDKYVKKLDTEKLLVLLMLAQLDQHRGLRDISNSLTDDRLSSKLNLESISHSQISRRLASVPTEAFQELLQDIVFKASTQMSCKVVSERLKNLHLIDSSTISLSLTQYPWAEFRKTKSGVKLHLRLQFFGTGMLPSKAIITPAKPADKTQMDNLVVVDEEAINVFDRGYIDYKAFDDYCDNNIRFVTRLKHNAVLGEWCKT